MTGVLLLVMLFVMLVVSMAMAGMFLMELLGAIRPLEFMAFAGNASQRDSHQQQGEKFHRGAS